MRFPQRADSADDDADAIFLPDCAFPEGFLPSSAFWLETIIAHSQITWLLPIDGFSAFRIGGGTSPSLMGSLGGLSVMGYLNDLPKRGSWRYGRRQVSRGSVVSRPPEFGFCIGNLFKQHVWTRIDIMNDISSVQVIYSNVDIMQNSRFKRIYLYEGEVAQYFINAEGEHILRLDIEKEIIDPAKIPIASGLSITSVDNGSYSVSINSVKENWDFVISAPTDPQIPSPGDYYKFDTVFCIEDPYLMSGDWIGSEDSTPANRKYNSGSNFYLTTHNDPYIEGTIVGRYVLYDNENSEVVKTVYPGAPIHDQGDLTWRWEDLGGYSEIYPSETRYTEEFGEGGRVIVKVRTTVDGSEFTDFLDEDPFFVRVELDKGGGRSRQNFYAPCLDGQYIQIGKNVHKILGHPQSAIIDVSRLAIDGVTIYDGTADDYKIVNQYGWMLNEHYIWTSDGIFGAFSGKVESATYDSATNLTTVSHEVTKEQITNLLIGETKETDQFSNDGDEFNSDWNSFANRFTQDISATAGATSAFVKGQGWYSVLDNGSGVFAIREVTSIDTVSSGDPYSLTYTILGDVSETLNGKVYIAFGPVFSTVGSASVKGFPCIIDVEAVSSGDTLPFLTSDRLAMDGAYTTPPYNLDIPIGTRLSITAAHLFGIENGSSRSNIGSETYMSVPDAGGGIASCYRSLNNTLSVYYLDKGSNTISLRRGRLKFRDLPSRADVSLGLPSEEAEDSSTSIQKDDSRLRSLIVEATYPSTPSADAPSQTMISIGSPDNKYGVVIEGGGEVRTNAFATDEVEYTISDFIDNSGNIIAPSYTWNNGESLFPFGVGVDTEVSLQIVGGASIKKQIFIEEKQLIGDINLYDAHITIDGDEILLYGANLQEFEIEDEKINPAEWPTTGAVMIVQGKDRMTAWGTPKRPFDDSADTDVERGEYAVMLLNGCKYLCSLYDETSNLLIVFAQCWSKGEIFIGCFIFSYLSVSNNLKKCTPDDDSIWPFAWRPLALDADILDDNSKNHVPIEDHIPDGYTFENDGVRDHFYRILGAEETNSQNEFSGGDFGYVSAYKSIEGGYFLLYDGLGDIKVLTSSAKGIGEGAWTESEIAISREGRAAVIIDHKLFYITSSGIVCKLTQPTDYQALIILANEYEGFDLDKLEDNVQDDFDNNRDIVILGTGPIPDQKITGFKDNEGALYVFYYDGNGNLGSMTSENKGRTWRSTNNF